MRRYLLGIAILCLAQFSWAEPPQPAPDEQIIIVKKGDTLGDIARALLDRPERWRDVAELNQLPNPHRIEPGQLLRIKHAWLKARPLSLTVEAVSGMATVDGKELKVGDSIPEGAQVVTAAGGALSLRAPDTSLVNVRELSEIKVEKVEQRGENRFISVLRLLAGQLEAFKAKRADGSADMTINARNATLGVRGTHFRMRQQDVKTYAEIEAGQVVFDAAKTPQVLTLAGGEGAVADGVKPAQVVPLLPVPSYPPLPEKFETHRVEWTMPELSGAQGYVGELARDAAFTEQVVAVRSEGNIIRLGDLANGHYWLKLRAVDAQGLQGREGKIDFDVAVSSPQLLLNRVDLNHNTLHLNWVNLAGSRDNPRYQVQIAVDPAFERIQVDAKTPESWIDVPRPQAGQYFLRVRALYADGLIGEWSEPIMFRVE